VPCGTGVFSGGENFLDSATGSGGDGVVPFWQLTAARLTHAMMKKILVCMWFFLLRLVIVLNAYRGQL
jgi:hypothetical protein